MSKIFDAYKRSGKLGKQVPVNEPDDQATIPPEGAAEATPHPEQEETGAIVAGQVQPFLLFPLQNDRQGEEFSKLANRILGLKAAKNGAVISFASTTSGEGASFVSYNAATALASVYSQKVVWVDGNFLSPQKNIPDDSRISFSALLKNPELVAGLPRGENPLLVPSGSNLMGARGFLAHPNYRLLLDRLAEVFDFVVLDLPPVLNSTDTALMAAETHGFLLVVEQKYLKWEIMEHGLQDMQDKNVNVLGSVINRREYELPKIIYDRL